MLLEAGRGQTVPSMSPCYLLLTLVDCRLFHFRYDSSDAAPTAAGPLDKRRDIAVVKVDIRGTPDANDLLSCLCSEFFPARYEHQQAIFEPSDVIAFQLLHNTAEGKGERQKFSYPTHLYLDQFMKENVRLAREKRSLQWQLHGEAEKLTQRKASLTRFNVRLLLSLSAVQRNIDHFPCRIGMHLPILDRHCTIMRTLQSIMIMKNVGQIYKVSLQPCALSLPESNPSSKVSILSSTQVFQYSNLSVAAIDRTITSLRQQADTVFSCPELQRYKVSLPLVVACALLLYSYLIM